MALGYLGATVTGRVVKDAVMTASPSGLFVTKTSIAVSTRPPSGSNEFGTTWVNATFFGKVAEKANNELKKGVEVFLTGELTATAYVDKKTGEARPSLDLLVATYRTFGPKPEVAPDPIDELPF